MRKTTLIFGCSGLLISGLAIAQQHGMPSGKMTDEDIIKRGLQEIEWVISGIIAADKLVDRGFLQV
jgi:hypothetical protein